MTQVPTQPQLKSVSAQETGSADKARATDEKVLHARLQEMHRRLGDNWFRYALAILKKSWHAAEDAMGTVMVKVLKSGLPEDVAKAEAFVLRVIRNECLDALRKQSRESRILEGQKLRTEECARPFLDPKTCDAMMELPDADREIVYLHVWEYMDVAAIADQVEMDRSKVERLLALNLARLQVIFGDIGDSK